MSRALAFLSILLLAPLGIGGRERPADSGVIAPSSFQTIPNDDAPMIHNFRVDGNPSGSRKAIIFRSSAYKGKYSSSLILTANVYSSTTNGGPYLSMAAGTTSAVKQITHTGWREVSVTVDISGQNNVFDIGVELGFASAVNQIENIQVKSLTIRRE